MAAVRGMSFFHLLGDEDTFLLTLWTVLIAALSVLVLGFWKWKKGKQSKCQRRVWDFLTSSQHARMHSSVPRQRDDISEKIYQMIKRLEAVKKQVETLVLVMHEESDDSTTWDTVSENGCCSSRTSPYPLNTSCGGMEAPCPHPEAWENLESSNPESKAKQGLGLSDVTKSLVMVSPMMQDLPFVNKGTKSHWEDPNIKTELLQNLQKCLSEPVLAHRGSQLPHQHRHPRRTICSPFLHWHNHARSRRSAKQDHGPLQRSASLPHARAQETEVADHAACYRAGEGHEDKPNRLLHLYVEQCAYVERKMADFLTDHPNLPANERSQGVTTPSDTPALVDAGDARVDERNSPEGRDRRQQGQKNTTDAQQPEGLPEHTLVQSSSSVVQGRPQCEPFRPQPAHAEMRHRHVAAEHRMPRPETPPHQLRSGCYVPALLCLFIRYGWAKLQAGGKALYSRIRKGSEKLLRKRR